MLNLITLVIGNEMASLWHTIENAKISLNDENLVILKKLELNGELDELRLIFQGLWGDQPYAKFNPYCDVQDYIKVLQSDDYHNQVEALSEILGVSKSVILSFGELAESYRHPAIKRLQFFAEGQVDVLALLTSSTLESKWLDTSRKIDTALFATASRIYHVYPPLFYENCNNLDRLFAGVSKPNGGFRPCAAPLALIDAINFVQALVEEKLR